MLHEHVNCGGCEAERECCAGAQIGTAPHQERDRTRLPSLATAPERQRMACGNVEARSAGRADAGKQNPQGEKGEEVASEEDARTGAEM